MAPCDLELEAQQMADKAAHSFKEKWKAHTMKLLNSTAGPFRKGELYVFAMTFDGVFLAHAANREFVGTSQALAKDARGNPLFPPCSR
jgi:cytochrome c